VMAKTGAPHARVLDHARCDGIVHLREELARVEGLGGEGLMLRQPGSKYIAGRSSTLLKVKTFHDTEARVIGHAPGTGKHKGRLGALVCELPSGARFNVGTGFSDAEREAPPKLGAVITFRYQELSEDGVPRFPSFVGERIDVELPKPTPKKAAKQPEPPPVQDAGDDFVAQYGAVTWKTSLVHDSEHKFWRIEVRGKHHIATFGKLGSTGQMRLTEIGSTTGARSDAEKRALAKKKEGYRLAKAGEA